MAEDEELKQAMSDRDKRINNITPLKGVEWQDKLRRTDNGGIKRGSLYNIRLYIENDTNLKGVLAYDEFTGKVVKLKSNKATGLQIGDWQDTDDSILRAYLDEHYQILFSKDNILDAMIRVARINTINPLKQRIGAVKWDGEARAESFFIDGVGAEDNHYTRMVTRKWLTGAVSRVYHPGVKFDIIPILMGAQGLGKSTLVRNLAPVYFNDDLKSMGKNKDDYQKLQGSWIVELAELSAMQKTDVETMKNFTSGSTDLFRNSYGRYATQHPRHCVFIGSTNHTDFLKDATGERRFYPIKCGVAKATHDPLKYDEPYLLQVIAEAKTWMDQGERLYFDKQTLSEAKVYQLEAQVVDPMKDAITDYLEMLVPTNWDQLTTSVKHTYYRDLINGSQSVNEISGQLSSEREPLKQTSIREVLAVVFNQQTDDYLAVRTNSHSKRIKLLLDNTDGWEYQRIRENGKQVRGYQRSED